MIADGESQALRDRQLTVLDTGIHELFDPPAVETHDVVVVRALVELEDGHAILEVMSRHQPRGLELGEHAIHGCQADVLVGVEELTINVLGRQVASLAALQYFENLQARQRHLQTGFAKVFAFHAASSRGHSRRREAHCRGVAIRYDSLHYHSTDPRETTSGPRACSMDRMNSSTLARPPRLILSLLVATLLLAGCVYRMNIQQGNFLEGRTVDQLQVGMTRSQVRYLLGTPMVPDAFDKERWDYLYYFKKGHLHKPEERHLIVYFKDDKVERFERNNIPNSAPLPMDQGPAVDKFPNI